jgi:heme/copper-type cytochrome/quinol oxidase subunit 3
MQQGLAKQGLSREEALALKNRRTAVTVFQISWIMVFVCLIVVNLQVRSSTPTWPPPGVEALDRVLPTLATVGLVASALLARSGLQAIQQDRRESFAWQWLFAIVLGIGFVAIMAFEWATVAFSGQYSTIFRVMTAYHGLHALVIGAILIRVYRSARAGAYDALHHWGVEAAVKLWYFVTVAWLMFYVVLYVI